MDASCLDTSARTVFPSGLSQPEKGFRFAVDSLLLACWAADVITKPGQRLLDLGCGCGVIGFGVAFRTAQGMHLTGVDSDPEMLAAARENVAHLGIPAQFLEADVREMRAHPGIDANSMDMVVCNPPWRNPGSGRMAAPERERARFMVEGSLEDFCAAASYALTTKGRFLIVHRADALGECMAACERAGLTPKRLRLIHSRLGEPGKLLLLEARKAAGPGMAIEPPLVLYDDASPEGGRAPLSTAALALCPFLACNAGNPANP